MREVESVCEEDIVFRTRVFFLSTMTVLGFSFYFPPRRDRTC